MGLDVIKNLNLVELKKAIKKYGLHKNAPADPYPIYESLGTIISREPLGGGRKACSGRLPNFIEPFAIFDSSLNDFELNHPLWHELSHLLFDPPGTIYCLCDHPKYLRQRFELTCELRAAYLAVSFEEMMQMYNDGWIDTQIAGTLKVPVHFLKLRHDIYFSQEFLKVG